jgi:histidine triad (HIT) family protein
MNDCLFCRIANQKKESLLWENEHAAAFKDINPKAPVHVLVVPKKHYTTFDDVEDRETAAELFKAVQEVAKQTGVTGGYRIVVNVGKPGGQVVDHLHLHILGGKKFTHEEIESAAE